MTYPLTMFGNPRGVRRPRDPRAIRFRDLRFNDIFEFDHTGLPLASGIARGPWVKLHKPREYTVAQGVGPVHRVGTINTLVVRLGAVGERTMTNPRARRPVRRNPETLPTLYAVPQSERVYEVKYKHVVDGDDYVHKFSKGVCMELLADGSVRLYRMDGRPLFRNFPD